MKTVKLSVFAIGVALSVTPIFNSALAQSSTDSASILLEMQTLRSEIAELRDMVERQQFEIKKLKQNTAKLQAPKNPSVYGQASGYNQGAAYQTANAGQGQGVVIPNSNPQVENYGQATPNTQNGLPVGASTTEFDNDLAASSPNTTTSVDVGTPAEVSAREYQATAQSNRPLPSQGAEIVERGVAGYPGRVPAPVTGSGQATVTDVTNVDSERTIIDVAQQNSNQNRPVLAVPGAPGQSPDGAPINAAGAPQAPQGQNSQLGGQQIAQANQTTEDDYYDRGFDFLKQSKYDEAVDVFKQQIAQYPQGDLADDAHYWIAEAMFISRKPQDAKPHLRAIIDDYPQSARLPDAMLKTAYIEQEMGNLIEARILLQEIVARHPSSNAAIAAKNRLENLRSGG